MLSRYLQPLPAGVLTKLDPEDEKYQSYLQMTKEKESLDCNHASEVRLKALDEELRRIVQNRKWKEAAELQIDVDY
jgi:hypothetical protein